MTSKKAKKHKMWRGIEPTITLVPKIAYNTPGTLCYHSKLLLPPLAGVEWKFNIPAARPRGSRESTRVPKDKLVLSLVAYVGLL